MANIHRHQSYTNFIWQPKERGGDIRCLSTEEIWRIQQLPNEDLCTLREYTLLWDHEGREDALQRAAGDSICKPMADVVAQLTERRIWQLEEKVTEISTVTNLEYEPPEDDYRVTETDSDEEGNGGHIETDLEQKKEESGLVDQEGMSSDEVGIDVLT